MPLHFKGLICRTRQHYRRQWLPKLSNCRRLARCVWRERFEKRLKDVKGLDIWYSAAYMNQTQEQQRFTISEVTANWHELMIPQRIMELPNWTCGAASRHTTAPISHARPSPRSLYAR